LPSHNVCQAVFGRNRGRLAGTLGDTVGFDQYMDAVRAVAGP
jgi:hypothetical protein